MADAFEHAVLLKLLDAGGPADVRVTSIPGLVILKIMAILDRPDVRVKKDTDDIQFIIANYLSAGNRSRLEYGTDSDLLQTQSLDLDPALRADLIERTIPDKPNSRLQKYRLTARGRSVLG